MWSNLEALFNYSVDTELLGVLSVSESKALINALPLLAMVAFLADLLHLNLVERLLG